MSKFHYIASNLEGKVSEGDIMADSSAAVLGWMADQGLRPVAIKETKERSWMKKNISESISIEDKVFITKYLSLMLKVGTDLFRAVDILVADFDKPSVKSLLLDVRETLSKGQPLYTAFAKYPKDFSPVFISLIRAGEESGNLEAVFSRLSKDTAKEKELRSKVKNALIYPIILVGLSFRDGYICPAQNRREFYERRYRTARFFQSSFYGRPFLPRQHAYYLARNPNRYRCSLSILFEDRGW
jgi:type II secretory pathway component PulF